MSVSAHRSRLDPCSVSLDYVRRFVSKLEQFGARSTKALANSMNPGRCRSMLGELGHSRATLATCGQIRRMLVELCLRAALFFQWSRFEFPGPRCSGRYLFLSAPCLGGGTQREIPVLSPLGASVCGQVGCLIEAQGISRLMCFVWVFRLPEEWRRLCLGRMFRKTLTLEGRSRSKSVVESVSTLSGLSSAWLGSFWT